MNNHIAINIVGILILLCFSFFFSCTETALFSLSSFKVKKIQRRHPRRGALVAGLLSNPRRLLISILIGNMFVNILSSTLGESLMRTLFGNEGTLLAIFVMSFAILVMGEVTPKTIAIQWNETIAPLVAPIINAISAFQAPVRRVVRSISDAIIAVLSRGISPSEHAVTEDEIKTALKIGSHEGVVDAYEKEMIQGVFDFAETKVGLIMRPRREIVALEMGTPIGKIEETIKRYGYSRIPIYESKLDNIVGILYAKDLIRAASQSATVNIREILRPAQFVPESQNAAALMKEFKKSKTHLAIVVDEYGGVSGLITLEDLLEQIVGEIRDKGDAILLYEKISKNTFRVNARMEIKEFNNLIGCDIRDPRNVTMGGFLVGQIGKIPREGHSLHYGNLHFTIASADKNRIREFTVARGRPELEEK